MHEVPLVVHAVLLVPTTLLPESKQHDLVLIQTAGHCAAMTTIADWFDIARSTP